MADKAPMERPVYIRLYLLEYLADTARGLRETEDHGAYMLLILEYYSNHGLPSEMDDIYDVCLATKDYQRAAVDKVLSKFFHFEQGRWVHHRIERDLLKMSGFLRSQRERGKRGGEANAKQTLSKRLPKAKANGASDHLDGFLAFKAAYPRREAFMAAAKAWAKLAPDAALQARIMAALGVQLVAGCLQDKRAADGRSVIPLPASWINQRRWEDEIHANSDGTAGTATSWREDRNEVLALAAKHGIRPVAGDSIASIADQVAEKMRG